MSADKPLTTPKAEAKWPRKFYFEVTLDEGLGGFSVRLDNRPLKTPGGVVCQLPNMKLAEAVAAEWRAQKTHIRLSGMRLTQLAFSVLDGGAREVSDAVDDILRHAGSDLLCYRAAHPEELQMAEAALWDPVLEWAARALDARLQTGTGIGFVAQPSEALESIKAHVAQLNKWQVLPVHQMTRLSGSALLALGVEIGFLSSEEAWEAAMVDELWQARHWGEDAESCTHRAARWADLKSAATFLELLS